MSNPNKIVMTRITRNMRLNRCAAAAAAGILTATLVLLSGAALVAQSVDFSGTYRFDKAASQVTPGAGLSGLGPGGMPHTIFVQQAANGSISVGSDMNQGQSRLYRFNGESALPAAKGDPITVKSRVEGRSLIAEGTGLKEVLTLSADGKTLTVAVTAGAAASTLTFTRMDTVDPCPSWPTPGVCGERKR
jgi:hypothetical protein